MTLHMLDIPELHSRRKEGKRLIRVLGEKADTEIFSHPSIQKIINYHWRNDRWFVWTFQFGPFLIQLAIFIYWHVEAIGYMNDSKLDFMWFNIVRL